MSRRHWLDLPPALRLAVETRVGGVEHATSVAAGSVHDYAAVLSTDAGRFFCKGLRIDQSLAWSLRNEIRMNPFLAGVAPALQWQVEVDGWLVAGFDHVDGGHADVSPGSPDLAAVAAVMTDLAERLTPCPVEPVQPAEVRWAGRLPADLVAGDTLLHTDVTPRNFLVGAGQTWVVDWSTPCRGAAWIDTALMVVRLIRAGHTPAEAETWASVVPAWAMAPVGALDLFATAVADLYRERLLQRPAPHRGPLAEAAASWAAHRSTALAR